jgi:hypothetical protein
MTAASPDASQQAVVEAALVLLERMGLSPADLTAVPQAGKPVATFAEDLDQVSAVSELGAQLFGPFEAEESVVGAPGDQRRDGEFAKSSVDHRQVFVVERADEALELGCRSGRRYERSEVLANLLVGQQLWVFEQGPETEIGPRDRRFVVHVLQHRSEVP